MPKFKHFSFRVAQTISINFSHLAAFGYFFLTKSTQYFNLILFAVYCNTCSFYFVQIQPFFPFCLTESILGIFDLFSNSFKSLQIFIINSPYYSKQFVSFNFFIFKHFCSWLAQTISIGFSHLVTLSIFFLLNILDISI